jgi:hypothetical protein
MTIKKALINSVKTLQSETTFKRLDNADGTEDGKVSTQTLQKLSKHWDDEQNAHGRALHEVSPVTVGTESFDNDVQEAAYVLANNGLDLADDGRAGALYILDGFDVGQPTQGKLNLDGFSTQEGMTAFINNVGSTMQGTLGEINEPKREDFSAEEWAEMGMED